MTRNSLAVVLAAWAWCGSADAAELQLFPTDSTLSGPNARQRFILVVVEGSAIVGDRTTQAKFTSSNPAVAEVDEQGVVRSRGDGEAMVTAELDGKKATAKVRVVKASQPSEVSFRNQVTPILTRLGCNSGACHGALAGKGGLKLSLRGYAPEQDYHAITRQVLGRRIDQKQPARSLLLLKPTMAVEHGGGQKLEAGSLEYGILAEWIASAAPPPRPQDPRVERLEVFPPNARLQPDDTIQMVVRAWYSDGSSEDVTRWAKFSSTEDLVARVDEDGRVQVNGHGETAITVWYSNLVAAVRVASPHRHQIAPEVFEKSPQQNFIDAAVLAKLRSLNIPPSGQCTDREFIRRLFLDAAGILPTPEEVEKFVADERADKRAKLVDAVLERPEFVDYWAYKWSDMLLVSSHRLPQQGVWAFYRFIRESVAENRPWDRFARDILTANGSTQRNGAVNYFVLHKDVADLTETTAVTFLGTSITCARCHNHPLEKWTQDQYWSMANLFARVALKNGDRAGEVTAQALPTGDAAHPRLGVPIPPAPLDGPPLALDDPSDRRVHFVRWLTAPDNPFFAKALVNRVWKNFLGRGLVEAEDDLRQTNPPSNQELFDALAKDFVAHRFDVKHLIRTIVNSAAYQRSSAPLPENVDDDRYYSRYLVRRLSAEVILDAFSQATGVPTPFDQIYAGVENNLNKTDQFPEGMRALQLPDSRVASYFLDAFGRPDRTVACACERQQDSSVTQALHVNNGRTLNDKLRSPKSRIEAWVKEQIDDDEAIHRVFAIALSRPPTEAERKKLTAILAEAAQDKQTTRREALEDLWWGVLTSREFLFNH